jgi:hypothetical protein
MMGMIALCHEKEDVKLKLEKKQTTSSRTHTWGQLRSSHGLFMGYGAGCEETTWWAKAMRKIFGHPVCTYFLYKLNFTPCRSSEY